MEENYSGGENAASNLTTTDSELRYNCLHAALNPALGDHRSAEDVLRDAKAFLEFVSGSKA